MEFLELTGALDDPAAVILDPDRRKQHRQERLAAAAGQPLARIARLYWDDPGDYLRDPDKFRQMLRPACRRCTARHGIAGPIACRLPPHQTVCRRHRLWAGPSACTPAGQLDVSPLPEILHAQRQHAALSHHRDWRRLGTAISDATYTVRDGGWTRASSSGSAASAPAPALTPWPGANPGWPGNGPSDPAIEIAIYPDVIRLATRTRSTVVALAGRG